MPISRARLRDGVQRRVAQLRRSEHGREILAYLRTGITQDPVGHHTQQRLAYAGDKAVTPIGTDRSRRPEMNTRSNSVTPEETRCT
jgi:hypothetical protein